MATTLPHTILCPWTHYKGGSVSGDVVDHRQLGEPGGGANHDGFVEMDSHCVLVRQSGCFPLCGRNEWFELEFGSNFWVTCAQPQIIQDVKVVLISMVEFGS